MKINLANPTTGMQKHGQTKACVRISGIAQFSQVGPCGYSLEGTIFVSPWLK